VSSAAESLWLAWEDCRSGLGLVNEEFGCGQNDATFDLICSFQPPAALTGVIGIEAVVDVQHGSAILPDWWQMGSGGCRQGELFAGADFTTLGNCADPWGGNAIAEIQGYDVGQPHGGVNQARIKAVAGVLPAQAVTLSADEIYYAVRIRFRTGLSAGAGSCSGCLSSACLVLNGITVRRLSGGDVTITTPAPGDQIWATWRGGAGADCGLVPARAVTWGRIKSLYR
jgi:hypothetical protein